MRVTLTEAPSNIGVEYWAPLNWNGQIIERYSISTCGRIYDHKEKQLKHFRIDKDGYYICDITIGYKKYKTIRVHRFVLMTFNFIPNFSEMVVNHKDTNKTNNWIGNLEWTTSIENTRHGWDSGANQNFGLNNGQGVYDDITVNKVCELIDKGLTNAEICNEFGIEDRVKRMRFSALVTNIKSGKTHRYISKNYNFMANTNIRRYGLDFAYLVCNFLADENKHYTYKEIMDILEMPNEERLGFKLYIDNLLSKHTAKNITELYEKLKAPLSGENDFTYLMR